VDNGSEFISKALDKRAYENGVALDFSRPGKPTDNPFIESFNGSFRDECLNSHWFLSLEDAREKIELWREEYNTFRPHSSLKYLMPVEFRDRHLDNDYNLVAPLTSEIASTNGERVSNYLDLQLSDDQMKSGGIAVQGLIFVPVNYGDAYGSEALKSSLTTREGDAPCDKKLPLEKGNIVFNYTRNKNIGKIRMTWELISLQ